MKKFFFVFAAAVLTMISCAKIENLKDSEEQTSTEPKPELELVEMSFSATSAFTRAHLESDRSVTFSANDKIAIFANGNKYTFTTAAGGANAVFTGVAEQADTYYALFPYSEGAGISGETITGVSLSSNSTIGTPGSFQSQRPIFVAKATGNSLLFKSAVALLKINVPSDVKNLTAINLFVRNKAVEACIVGTASITVTDSDPTVEVTTVPTGDNCVSLYGAGGGAIASGDYYLPVFPAHYSGGFDLKLSFDKEFVGRTGNGAEFTFVTGHVYNLGSVKKRKGFVYDSFENESITGGNSTNYTGNSFKVAVNPYVTDVNGSGKVLALDLHNRSAATPSSGLMTHTFSTVKFPKISDYRDKFKTVAIKIYWGTEHYYPCLQRNQTGVYTRPARLNGQSFTDQASWDALVRTDDWNELEWDIDQWSDGSMFGFNSFNLKTFIDWDQNSLKTGDGYLLTAYFDDIAIINDEPLN